LAASEFNFGGIEEGGAGIDAGHDAVEFFEAFEDVGNDAVREGHRYIAGSDASEGGLNEGFADAFPGAAAAFFEISKALEDGLSPADGGGKLGDRFGIGDGVFNWFGEMDFAEESEIRVGRAVIGVRMAVDANVAAVSFFGDMAVWAGAEGADDIVEGPGSRTIS